MEKQITYSISNCFICREIVDSSKIELSVATAASEKPVYKFIEEFFDIAMTDEILEDAAICQSCYTKFHEYDQYRTQAFKIQSALVDLFNTSSFEEAEAFHTELVKAEELSDLNIYSEPCDDHQEPFLGNEDFTEDHGEFVWANEENIMINNRQKKESPIKTVPLTSKAKMPRKQDGKPKKVRQVRTDERKFQCEICLKCFKEKSKWKVHRDIHKDERNVVCPVCGKAFKTRACLRSHKRVHNQVRVYCDICGKAYTQKHELTKHIKFFHLLIRNFNCENCNASFASRAQLGVHMMTHEEVSLRTFHCTICPVSFHTKAKLSRHMLSHTKERNFECHICNQRFMYSYNVRAHIKHVHQREKRKKEEERICRICGKNFRKLWCLENHIREGHAIEMQEEIIIYEEVDPEDTMT